MKFKLSVKIFLAFLLLTVINVVLMSTLIKHFANRDFEMYIKQNDLEKLESLADTMATFYREHNGWQSLIKNYELWATLLRSVISKDEFQRPYEPQVPFNESNNRDSSATVTSSSPPIWDPFNVGLPFCLFDAEKKRVTGSPGAFEEFTVVPISVDEKTVGWLGLKSGAQRSHPLDQAFLQKQSKVFYMIGVATLLVSMIIALLLSKNLLTPIRQVSEATKELTLRNFSTRIPVKSSDELGNLARSFNEMAQKLEDYERKQQQWLSDISHELRTPLSVLIGEIEALQDGIRKPDDASLTSLGDEARHLISIVNDLSDLSLAEAGVLSMKKEAFKPLSILNQTVYIFKNRFESAGMTIDLDLGETTGDVKMIGDPGRIMQLFSNLLANALSHTMKPGKLTIRQNCTADQLKLIFGDTGPGVPENALPKLFDRLYRADPSRSRMTGGSGLGLAICKSIVEKHSGIIRAQNMENGGFNIEVMLPILFDPYSVNVNHSIRV